MAHNPDHPAFLVEDDDAPPIPVDLAALAVPTDSLTPYHRNPRRGDLITIAFSLKKHGQFKAIVVNRGTHTGRPREILAGNHTFAAAKLRGWTEIAATWVDVDDDSAKRIVVVDNRSGDLGGYDSELLAEILEELPDLEGTGYDQAALDGLLDSVLPSVLEAETRTSDGDPVSSDHIQWGYVQWGETRVRITQDEVERLDRVHQAYYDARGTNGGFVHHIIDATDPGESASGDDGNKDAEPAPSGEPVDA